jgi:MFS family permease
MQDYFDRQVFKKSVNATELSFVGTIGFAFCGLMGPVVPLLMSLVGARWLLFFGTLLISAGLILASYSTQVWQLYITQSVMHGMGAAFLYIVKIEKTCLNNKTLTLPLGVDVYITTMVRQETRFSYGHHE